MNPNLLLWDITGYDERFSDAVFGLPPEVNQFFVDGRQLYIDEMDIALTDIANYVAEKLNEAKERINQGKQEIQEYVAGLPDNLRQVGEDAAQNIQSQFDQLEESVNNKQNELIDSLAQQYSTSLQEVDARIEEMQAENQGLVNQFTDMMGGVFNTMGQIRSMLEGVLAGAAGAIGAILSDPIGFLGNLISGVKQGLDNFVGNIATHLQGGLVAWLTGTMGGLGIQIPDDLFSLEGIFNLVAQILGLTWDYIRSKAVRMFGDPVVAAMEQGLEMFQVFQTEGAIALWEQVQDQFTDLKEQVIDQIKDMVITQVIQSGVSWMLGLLTPAGAFVKAAQTIYNIVMFFVNRGSQVVELVQAITESIGAIASGALGQAASLVESALAKALPVAIGFLASLIGVSGLARKVQDVVEGIRKRVDDAIEFVLKKAKQMAASLLRRLGIGRGEEGEPDERTMEEKEADVGRAVAEAEQHMDEDGANSKSVEAELPELKSKYRLKSANIVETDSDTYYVEVEINPKAKTKEKEDDSPPKRGHHIFNNSLRQTVDELKNLVASSSATPLIEAVNSTEDILNSNVFELTVSKENESAAGGDTNSRIYGAVKERFLSRLQQVLDPEQESDSSGLSQLLDRWIDSALDRDAEQILQEKGTGEEKRKLNQGKQKLDRISDLLKAAIEQLPTNQDRNCPAEVIQVRDTSRSDIEDTQILIDDKHINNQTLIRQKQQELRTIEGKNRTPIQNEIAALEQLDRDIMVLNAILQEQRERWNEARNMECKDDDDKELLIEEFTDIINVLRDSVKKKIDTI
ncbi:phage tail protein [Coleofasciculus sp.]|uniref:phage tail protein n=1 Tax=Coleofasciculus sp. TaxID=3100458 RepID=UPI003A3AF0E2